MLRWMTAFVVVGTSVLDGVLVGYCRHGRPLELPQPLMWIEIGLLTYLNAVVLVVLGHVLLGRVDAGPALSGTRSVLSLKWILGLAVTYYFLLTFVCPFLPWETAVRYEVLLPALTVILVAQGGRAEGRGSFVSAGGQAKLGWLEGPMDGTSRAIDG